MTRSTWVCESPWGPGKRVRLIMRPSLCLFAFMSCSGYAGAVMLSLGVHSALQGHPVPTKAMRSRTVRRGGGACESALAMSGEEAQGNDSDSAYLSPTKLTREQFLLGGLAAFFGSAYVGANQDQRSYRARKRDLFRSITRGGADGFRDILEVGVGGNPKVGGFSNLEYYSRGQRIVGVDPALSGEPSEALEKAEAKAKQLGLTLRGVAGMAEELPFESGSFDAVVSTFVFCSVRDPEASLREVSRVLRPGGKFLFVEHIHAPEEGLSILGLRQQQDLLDPLQQRLADGCHLTRETGRLIKDSTDGPPSSSRLFSRIERLEEVRVKSMWPVSEQVLGVVVK